LPFRNKKVHFVAIEQVARSRYGVIFSHPFRDPGQGYRRKPA